MKFFLTLLFFLSFNLQAKPIPPLSSAVVDQARLLSKNTRNSLSSILSKVAIQGSLQMAILTINDLEDESLEGFSIKVVDKWKLGSKEKDNGLLLLIAKKQRKMRIEVGQGLEGIMTDAVSGRIIDRMKSYFKAGDFDQGVIIAVASIFQKLGIKTNDTQFVQQKSKKKKTSSFASLIFFLFFIFIFRKNPLLAMYMLSGSRRSSGRGFGGGGFSGGGGGFSGGGASGDW